MAFGLVNPRKMRYVVYVNQNIEDLYDKYPFPQKDPGKQYIERVERPLSFALFQPPRFAKKNVEETKEAFETKKLEKVSHLPRLKIPGQARRMLATKS